MKSKKDKPLTSSQAMKNMAEFCKSIGVKFTHDQPKNGTASISFRNKPKKK